jgi:nucleoside-diphosphate-sugar epimerase
MRVLVVGGSGDVGTLMLPFLAQQHTLRVFDLRPPVHTQCAYVAGDVTDLDALKRAAEGMDILLYMAMGHKHYDTVQGVVSNLDVNIKGVYLALWAAHQAGIGHAVYTSTLSIYEKLESL